MGAAAAPEERATTQPAEPSFDEKLRFLQSAAAHPGAGHAPECVETHMSWVFLTADRVLKLKKPVRSDIPGRD
jgi:uncharacterized protein